MKAFPLGPLRTTAPLPNCGRVTERLQEDPVSRCLPSAPRFDRLTLWRRLWPPPVPALINRPPTADELSRFLFMISTATDGTGKNRHEAGGTYPDYALIEDATAEAFGGRTVKAKDVFDVLVPDGKDPHHVYGISCKMKQNDATCVRRKRVYIEYANADSEFLGAVSKAGYTKQELIDHKAPAVACGQAVIEVARQWHNRTANGHKGLKAGERLDPEKSIHLVLSYNWNSAQAGLFDYYLYVFPHLLPQVDLWTYGPASLRGYESAADQAADEPFYTYNFNSGGHLKWYPKAASATHRFGPFTLRRAPPVTLRERAKLYFPKEWPADSK